MEQSRENKQERGKKRKLKYFLFKYLYAEYYPFLVGSKRIKKNQEGSKKVRMESLDLQSAGGTLDYEADFSDCLDILSPDLGTKSSDDPGPTIDAFGAFASLNSEEMKCILTETSWGQVHRKTYVQPTYITRHNKKSAKCKNCNGNYERVESEQICQTCGVVESIEGGGDDGGGGISTLSIGSYNTSSESANPVRVTGPGGMLLQKKLMCTVSDYEKTKFKNTIKSMINITQKYTECLIPMDVVKLAANRYYEVQCVGTIKRGNVHSGAMATCLMRTCDQSGIHKKREVFAKMFKIDLSDLSAGEKLIDTYVAEGRIKKDDFQVPNPENTNIGAYIVQYFLNLRIPLPPNVGDTGCSNANISVGDTGTGSDKYYAFVKRLIEFTIKFRIADNSVEYSKCAGAIHVIVSRCPELSIEADQIAKECSISKSTFKRFSNTITDLLTTSDERKIRLKKKLLHLFNKFGIPIALK